MRMCSVASEYSIAGACAIVLAFAAAQVYAEPAPRATQEAQAKAYSPLTYPDSGLPFLEERERGWHWYENPEDERLEEPPPPPSPPEPTPQQPEPAAPKGPKPLSSEWLKENLPKFLNRAIDEPTHENVAAYLYLQRLTMKKADKFSEQAMVTVAKEPWLDQNAQHPISDAGTAAAGRMAAEMSNRIVAKLAKDTGILFFFRSDCKFCHMQWPLLQMYAQSSGFTIMPVSMDGGLLPGMDPKTVQLDRGQSQLFNVSVTPTLFLFQPKTRNAVPIANGFIALTEIQPALVRMAADAGLVNIKDFEISRGVLPVATSTPGPIAPEHLMQQATEEDVADSKSLYNYMKGKLRNHGQ